MGDNDRMASVVMNAVSVVGDDGVNSVFLYYILRIPVLVEYHKEKVGYLLC